MNFYKRARRRRREPKAKKRFVLLGRYWPVAYTEYGMCDMVSQRKKRFGMGAKS